MICQMVHLRCATAGYAAALALDDMGSWPLGTCLSNTGRPQHLQSMSRLSEAYACMRLSSFIELACIEPSNTGAHDPTICEIDMALLDTGIGRQQRKFAAIWSLRCSAAPMRMAWHANPQPFASAEIV